MAQKFDPITLEILWRRIISIVDEADASVGRTAFSSRDAHDYTCMFADRKGREIAQGTFCTPGRFIKGNVPWNKRLGSQGETIFTCQFCGTEARNQRPKANRPEEQ